VRVLVCVCNCESWMLLQMVVFSFFSRKGLRLLYPCFLGRSFRQSALDLDAMAVVMGGWRESVGERWVAGVKKDLACGEWKGESARSGVECKEMR
jgi:hypothetical protein